MPEDIFLHLFVDFAGIFAVTTVMYLYTKGQTMTSQSKSQKYAAWQKAEDKEARAQRRWKKFGRNCEIAKSEFIAARNQTIAAYRAYKQHQ